MVSMSTRLKRSIAASVAAIVVGGATIGIVSAQPNPAGSPTPGGQGQQNQERQQRRDQFLSTLAGKLGVSVDQLRQALTETRSELGMQGKPGGFQRGEGPRGPGGEGMRFGLQAAASALNLSPDQLRQELAGKSLADVARAHNVDPTTVANALKAQADSQIDQAVAAGRLNADQAAQAKQRASQRIDDLMNRTLPMPGQGFQGPRGPRGGQGQTQ